MEITPVNQDIRIGVVIRYDDQFLKYLSEIIKLGFESISIAFKGEIGSISLSRLAEECQKILSPHNAIISSICLYANPLESRQAVRDWERLIRAAGAFSTRIVGGFTGRIPNKSIKDNIPRFKQIFGDLALQAEENGVCIAFENCAQGGNWEYGKNNIAHNPAAWELMFSSLSNTNLGLQWEPCHQMVALADPLSQIKEWGARIFHIHGKDATVYQDVIQKHGIHSDRQFAHHRTPGFGDSDWRKIISELRRVGFSGSIDIEGWHDPVYRDDLELTGQVAALRYLKECRGGEFVENIR